ncbi:hypothetical protein NFI96_008656 [Prochilodus magdalenae]|nr:hypothetical protein NFI96_008656 [Prochilodus magdalenae]
MAPSSHQKLKSTLKEKCQKINEGISNPGTSKLLNEIYTELYITEGGSGEVNNEHEVRQIETTSRRPIIQETPIKCNDIFKDESIRTVLTKGVAGIGKTVSVQKFILDWAEGKANQDVLFIFPLPFREMNLMKEKFSLEALLHQFFKDTKNLKPRDYHHYKVMFIFDGLDEYRLPLDFQKNNENVTEVRGFSDPQKEEYFRKRISDQSLAKGIITHVKSSRSLYIMCHIPVFCWIAAHCSREDVEVLGEAESGEIPKTLTQMFTHFLIFQIKHSSQKYQRRSDTDHEQTREIILALGELAFHQLDKGNLIFYEEDLRECGIDVREVSVYSGVCTQIFREEFGLHLGKVFSFVHLSVQEFLAALYVFLSFISNNRNVLLQQDTGPTRTMSDFLKSAVDKALQSENGHLDLFLRFLLGLSLESNQTVLRDALTQTGNRSYNKEEIVEYIKKKIRENPSPEKTINLFHCLNELNDHSLVQEVQTYLNRGGSSGLSGAKLSPAQWSAVAFVMLNSEEELEEFDLSKFDRSEECLLRLLPVVRVSRKVVVSSSSIEERGCAALLSSLKSNPLHLRELNMNYSNPGESGVKLLSDLLEDPHCKLETLHLSFCSITGEGCAALVSALKSNPSHLRELDLGWNNPGESGVKLLSDLLEDPHCKLEKLQCFGCGQEGHLRRSCPEKVEEGPSRASNSWPTGNDAGQVSDTEAGPGTAGEWAADPRADSMADIDPDIKTQDEEGVVATRPDTETRSATAVGQECSEPESDGLGANADVGAGAVFAAVGSVLEEEDIGTDAVAEKSVFKTPSGKRKMKWTKPSDSKGKTQWVAGVWSEKQALAIRMREVMGHVIHLDQTYCVPGRSITDNISLVKDVLEVSSIDSGLISLDQEKAFDRVEHQYLWDTLEAFGFSPSFSAMFIIKFLTGPVDLVWRKVASVILRKADGLGLDTALFLMDCKQLRLSGLPLFYRGLFKCWALFKTNRLRPSTSLFWLLEEPLLKGSRLDVVSGVSGLTQSLCTANMVKLQHLVDTAGLGLGDAQIVASVLGQRSVRQIRTVLDLWVKRLDPEDWSLLQGYWSGSAVSNGRDPFPNTGFTPDFTDMSGPLMDLNGLRDTNLGTASGSPLCGGSATGVFAGTMAAPTSTLYESLTRRHCVKVECRVSVEECCLAVGSVVGHSNIVSASWMNNAVALFLNTVENANGLVQTSIVLQDQVTPGLPLSTPAKKVILSNIPSFIKDEHIIRELSQLGLPHLENPPWL